MSPRSRYIIRPLDQGLSYAQAALHSPAGAMLYPAKNIKIDQHSAKKRWGYSTAHRTLKTSADVLNIVYFKEKDGTENTIYLTGEDACLKQAGGSNTFSYITETYTTGTITDITGTTVTGSGTAWNTAPAMAAGDQFIMDDDHSANIEDDSSWEGIASVTSDTELELDSAYTKNGTTYKIRKAYTTPSNEYWSWAIVNNIFHFSNGNTNVQKWTGTGTSTDLDGTNAVKARYLIEYANRLILADYGSTRDPYSIQWSKNLDPTDWTDASAGSAQLLDSLDYITGLGKVGAYLVIFKEESYHLAHRTGIYTEPINIPIHKIGKGCPAPWSIVQFQGTVAWLGRDDFYVMDGTWASSIGLQIRDFFLEEVTETNREKTYGFVNSIERENIWLATTTSYGLLGFIYRWQTKDWVVYDYNDAIKSGGRGV
ncbi:MAG: hypothetical protein V3V81_08080 [Candidatus Bathyarchaeia archaeon]